MKELTVTLSYPGEAQPVTWKIESAQGLPNAIKSITASLKKEAGTNNIGRKKTHDKPSAETLRRDFTSIARENLRLNGTQIADRMKASYHVKYASVPSSTIVRWLSEDGISIKEIKRSVRAQINLDK
jgi:type II secretory pathway component PulM